MDGSHRLVRIGLKGRNVQLAKRPASNLVFLLDTSGSMNGADRLPLVKQSMSSWSNSSTSATASRSSPTPVAPGSYCRPRLETSARRSLPRSTSCRPVGPPMVVKASSSRTRRPPRLSSRAAPIGDPGDGRRLQHGRHRQGRARAADPGKAKTGVFCRCWLRHRQPKDATMETLADKGNGNYAYIDGLAEAKKCSSIKWAARSSPSPRT